MKNEPIGTKGSFGISRPDNAKKTGEEEKSTMGKIKDFFERNILETDDCGDFKVNKKMYGLAAGEAAVGGGVGYVIGAGHEAKDVVTHETIMKDVMTSVKVGEKTVTGGYHHHYGYHYDFMEGEYKFGWNYGYDASWVHQESVYERVPTGEKVAEVLTHHTEKFPYTALQGLLAGTLIGAAAGVVTLVAAKIIAASKP